MLDTICYHPKSKDLDASDSLLAGVSVNERARQLRHFGDPATVVFPTQLDR
jgi:hypothetical protein